jgi:hypothetical protein
MKEQSRVVTDRTLSRLPRTELDRRWALVRDELKARDIKALVVLSSEDFLGGYVRWLTDRPAYAGYHSVAIFHADEQMTLIEHGPLGLKRNSTGDEPDYPGIGEILTTVAFHSASPSHHYEAELAIAALARRGHRRIALAGAAQCPTPSSRR